MGTETGYTKDARMIELGLNKPYPVESTEEDLRKKLVKATKARNILEYEDFKWWFDNVVDPRVVLQVSALIWKDEEPKEYHIRRGTIRGINKFIHELRKHAADVDKLEKELAEYDRRTKPVAREA